MTGWIYLFLAALFEIGWAIGLKYTDGFTRPLPSLLTAASMVASLALLGLAVKTLPLGTAYVIWTGIGAAGAFVVGMVFEDEEVVCAGGKMDIDRGRQRAAGIVRRDADIMSVGNGRDLLLFPQATGHADVGLYDVDGLEFEQFTEFVTGVEHFARCQRHVAQVAQLGHGVAIFRAQRLFDKHGAEGCNHLAQLDRT